VFLCCRKEEGRGKYNSQKKLLLLQIPVREGAYHKYLKYVWPNMSAFACWVFVSLYLCLSLSLCVSLFVSFSVSGSLSPPLLPSLTHTHTHTYTHTQKHTDTHHTHTHTHSTYIHTYMRQRQAELCEFKVSLVYIECSVRSGPTRAIVRLVSKISK
jgi:hypothetical protein